MIGLPCNEEIICYNMLCCFYTIVARDGQTDGQISYINIARQRVDAR